jgi:hypothetical protein
VQNSPKEHKEQYIPKIEKMVLSLTVRPIGNYMDIWIQFDPQHPMTLYFAAPLHAKTDTVAVLRQETKAVRH